ncbi:ROK family protein [Nonomuraea sp. CA-143628]|uniref:ROK family protein n=1 Tax=Nonomuraea sp. CA-143628 TaxID=3239997 RepID=UPI003D8D20C2
MTTRTALQGRQLGQQLDSLRRGNAAAVLSEIRARGAVSRSEIASSVGLSAAAITKIIIELERAEYIAEAPQTEPASAQARGRGRPRRPITLNPHRHRFVGVHVGLQRVTVGLVDLAGQVVALRSRKHGSAAPRTVLSTATRLVREMVEQSGVRREDVVGYGACTGGWVPPESGAVRTFEGLGWHDVAFSEGLRVDGLPVPRVESTVRALALAEARLAADAGARNVLYVFVGNVIGCAHVVHGDIARGQHDAAGLIDHVSSGSRSAVPCTCGRRDCLWAVASDAALTLEAQQRGLLPGGTTIDDLVKISEGRTVRRMLELRAARVGTTVAALIDVHDPDLAIIGGGEVVSSTERFEQVVSAARERVVGGREPTPIQPAVLVGPSGLVQGAATPVLDAFYADPLARP